MELGITGEGEYSKQQFDDLFGGCLPITLKSRFLWGNMALEKHGDISSHEVTPPLRNPFFPPMPIVSVLSIGV